MPPTTMQSHLDNLLEKRQQISDNLDAIMSEDFDPASPDLTALQDTATRLERQIEMVRKGIETRQTADALTTRMGRVPATMTTDDLDVGEALVRSEMFQAWRRAGASGRAKLMEIPMRRALLTTTTVPNGPPDRVYAAAPYQQTSLLASINRQQVSSGAVDVITYPSSDPLAGVVPEGTMKPEATITVTQTTVNLQTLAHWIEATRQIIEDEQRLRDFITNSLMRGVMDKAEADAAAVVAAGTGYGDAPAENMLKAIRIGIAQVNSAGFRPNVVLVNPLDAADLDYEVWSGAGAGAPSGYGSVWGVPVVPNGALAEGTAYVADGNVAWHHYFRGTADLYVSDSDVGPAGESNFKRNILTFLAEYRCRTHVVRPEAASKCHVVPPVVGTAATARSGK